MSDPTVPVATGERGGNRELVEVFASHVVTQTIWAVEAVEYDSDESESQHAPDTRTTHRDSGEVKVDENEKVVENEKASVYQPSVIQEDNNLPSPAARAVDNDLDNIYDVSDDSIPPIESRPRLTLFSGNPFARNGFTCINRQRYMPLMSNLLPRVWGLNLPFKSVSWFTLIRLANIGLAIGWLIVAIYAANLHKYSGSPPSVAASFFSFVGFALSLWFYGSRLLRYSGYTLLSITNIALGMIVVGCLASSYNTLGTLQTCLAGKWSAGRVYGSFKYVSDVTNCAMKDHAHDEKDCNCMNSISNDCIIYSGGYGFCQDMVDYSPSLSKTTFGLSFISLFISIIIPFGLYLKVTKNDVDIARLSWSQDSYWTIMSIIDATFERAFNSLVLSSTSDVEISAVRMKPQAQQNGAEATKISFWLKVIHFGHIGLIISWLVIAIVAAILHKYSGSSPSAAASVFSFVGFALYMLIYVTRKIHYSRYVMISISNVICWFIVMGCLTSSYYYLGTLETCLAGSWGTGRIYGNQKLADDAMACSHTNHPYSSFNCNCINAHDDCVVYIGGKDECHLMIKYSPALSKTAFVLLWLPLLASIIVILGFYFTVKNGKKDDVDVSRSAWYIKPNPSAIWPAYSAFYELFPRSIRDTANEDVTMESQVADNPPQYGDGRV